MNLPLGKIITKLIVGFSLAGLVIANGIPEENDPTGRPTCEGGHNKQEKYLLYNVNPGEGFNLRRDVYLRMANLVRSLNKFEHWVLVLPPWGNLYHWKNTDRWNYFPWQSFFDIDSLNKWIPVVEFQHFLKVNGPNVDMTYMLQHYEEGWTGHWEEKYDLKPCIEQNPFVSHDDGGEWSAVVWGSKISSKNVSCLSVQGHASTLMPLFTSNKLRSVFVGRAETVLHDDFGGAEFWSARRSMRFAHHLQMEADEFRKKFLDSDDVRDATQRTQDWRDSKPKRSSAKGGAYVSVHLRRRDFIYARGDEVPSLKRAAKQIIKLLKSHSLNKVFVATDAPPEEIEDLQELLRGYEMFHFVPSEDMLRQWGDGGVAIVDQIICSYARIFIGSYESTFSFRIQEEREMLGFLAETTFNRLCGKNKKCDQPSQWKIVY